MTVPHPRSSGPSRLRRAREAGGVAGPQTSWAWPFSWPIATVVSQLPTNVGGAVTAYAIESGALPDGVELNTATGEITGTPVGEGTGSAVIRATNASGYDDATVEWEVAAA